MHYELSAPLHSDTAESVLVRPDRGTPVVAKPSQMVHWIIREVVYILCLS